MQIFLKFLEVISYSIQYGAIDCDCFWKSRRTFFFRRPKFIVSNETLFEILEVISLSILRRN